MMPTIVTLCLYVCRSFDEGQLMSPDLTAKFVVGDSSTAKGRWVRNAFCSITSAGVTVWQLYGGLSVRLHKRLIAR
jgi:hypothetical protein